MRPAERLHVAAAALYWRSGRFPFFFARGKLRHDRVFADLLARGCLARSDREAARILDLGCGQGLLLAALHAAAQNERAGRDGAPPDARRVAWIRGYDALASNVRWGRAMLAGRTGHAIDADIERADIRDLALPACDVVIAIDVLHYLAFGEQEALLQRIHRALAPGGHLVLRVSDAAHPRPQRVSAWVDSLVARLRGQERRALCPRAFGQWRELLERTGFAVRTIEVYRSWSAVNVLVRGDKLN